MMHLKVEVRGNHLQVELVRPIHFAELADASFVDIRSPLVKSHLVGRWERKNKLIAIGVGRHSDGNLISMKLVDGNHLSLSYFHGNVPDWTFEKLQGADHVVLKTNWPNETMDSAISELKQQLQTLAEEDREARLREHIDEEETDRLSSQALPFINRIFEAYGWPTFTRFGSQAASDFWLLVQHQPLEIQKRMVGSLQELVRIREVSSVDYAFLFDRIETEEGRPQHWGTQSRCEDGHASLYPLDASENEVNLRRKQVGLSPLTGHESDGLCHRMLGLS